MPRTAVRNLLSPNQTERPLTETPLKHPRKKASQARTPHTLQPPRLRELMIRVHCSGTRPTRVSYVGGRCRFLRSSTCTCNRGRQRRRTRCPPQTLPAEPKWPHESFHDQGRSVCVLRRIAVNASASWAPVQGVRYRPRRYWRWKHDSSQMLRRLASAFFFSACWPWASCLLALPSARRSNQCCCLEASTPATKIIGQL